MVKSYPKIILLGDSLTEGAFGVDGYGSAMVAEVSAFSTYRQAPGFNIWVSSNLISPLFLDSGPPNATS
jgi:hypothetical protein